MSINVYQRKKKHNLNEEVTSCTKKYVDDVQDHPIVALKRVIGFVRPVNSTYPISLSMILVITKILIRKSFLLKGS
jgi:hypothetical protein